MVGLGLWALVFDASKSLEAPLATVAAVAAVLLVRRLPPDLHARLPRSPAWRRVVLASPRRFVVDAARVLAHLVRPGPGRLVDAPIDAALLRPIGGRAGVYFVASALPNSIALEIVRERDGERMRVHQLASDDAPVVPA